jgi:hypothetical protein
LEEQLSKNTNILAQVCLHVGAKACQLSLLEKHVEMAVRNKWNILLLGDTIDNGVSSGSKHVGLEWQNTMDPMSQCEKVVEIYAEAAKRGLIKGIFGGNHPFRSVKAVGLHPEKFIAMMLSLISDPSKKPQAVLPSIIQRVHEVYGLMQDTIAQGGGVAAMQYAVARAKLNEDLQKVKPGTETGWSIPFHPGVGYLEIDGIPVAAHHGAHTKSKDNWMALERATRGFRLYFTGHNHQMAYAHDYDNYRGQKKRVDYFSCGTYQGWEEYAQIAPYPCRPVGSMLVEYDHKHDHAKCQVLID